MFKRAFRVRSDCALHFGFPGRGGADDVFALCSCIFLDSCAATLNSFDWPRLCIRLSTHFPVCAVLLAGLRHNLQTRHLTPCPDLAFYLPPIMCCAYKICVYFHKASHAHLSFPYLHDTRPGDPPPRPSATFASHLNRFITLSVFVHRGVSFFARTVLVLAFPTPKQPFTTSSSSYSCLIVIIHVTPAPPLIPLPSTSNTSTESGLIKMSTYLIIYQVGDIVDIKANASAVCLTSTTTAAPESSTTSLFALSVLSFTRSSGTGTWRR